MIPTRCSLTCTQLGSSAPIPCWGSPVLLWSSRGPHVFLPAHPHGWESRVAERKNPKNILFKPLCATLTSHWASQSMAELRIRPGTVTGTWQGDGSREE